jgi:hypothetical protein
MAKAATVEADIVAVALLTTPPAPSPVDVPWAV